MHERAQHQRVQVHSPAGTAAPSVALYVGPVGGHVPTQVKHLHSMFVSGDGRGSLYGFVVGGL